MLRSLRARLTLLYVALISGMFLVFGAAVYGLVGVILMRQVDRVLEETVQAIVQQGQVKDMGHPQFVLPPDMTFTVGVLVQVWDRDNHLVAASAALDGSRQPLAPRGLAINAPAFYTEHRWRQPWRVLSAPVFLGRRRVATVQVAAPLDMVYNAKRALLWALLTVTLAGTLLVGLVGYWSVRVALEPLAHVTALADQITHADDLSRRIPVPRGAGDEVWTLVRAFNATLSRLEALFQSQRRFIADVGHELRTPLTVIKGNAQWMRRIGKLDPEALDSIEEETDRLNRLVEDLLLLARAEAGRLPLRREAVDLDTVLAEVLREMQVMAREKVHLEAQIAPLRVGGDPDRLKQVFLNLVSNAIKYTPQGGRVAVQMEEEDGWAVVRVSDTGPGIPPEDLPHVFERFYRADKARSRGKGFGLGLSIVYWIVKHHGGRIDVTSQLGQGTTFTVWLPLYSEDEAKSDHNPPDNQANQATRQPGSQPPFPPKK